MTMTTEEIVREYKLAKDKRKQIEILADQNCVSKKEIATLLSENGQEVDRRYFPKKADKEPIIPADPERIPLTADDAYSLAAVLDITLAGISFESARELVSFVHALEKLCIYGGYDLDHKEGEADAELPVAKLPEDPVHD